MTTFELGPYVEDATRIVGDVFRTMLELETYPAEDGWIRTKDQLTAAVFFAGSWTGGVIFECTKAQACEFARRFLQADEPMAFDADVADTMGELANMIGGNLKSILPHGVSLSMPSVVEGGDYSMRLCGGNLTERSVFVTEFGACSVTLVEMAATAPKRPGIGN